MNKPMPVVPGDYSRMKPGEARCPAPSVQEIIRGDAKPAPEVLAHEHCQQQGFKAAVKKRGQTLGNYQEVRIRHLHHTLDKYLFGDVAIGAEGSSGR